MISTTRFLYREVRHCDYFVSDVCPHSHRSKHSSAYESRYRQHGAGQGVAAEIKATIKATNTNFDTSATAIGQLRKLESARRSSSR